MSLYDVIDDISAKQVTKTDTGDTRVNGVLVGVVTKNYSDKYKGRVCVEIPSRDKKHNELLWVRVVQPSSGKAYGHYFLPEPKDEVLVAFEGGNIEKPYIIGCVPKDDSKLVSGASNEKNEIKRIVSTRGNTIELNDKEDKEFVTITTPEKAQEFTLDKGEQKITLKDKEGNVSFIANTKDGKVTLKIKSNLTIEVGEVKITVNGDAGNVKIDCTNFAVEASGELKMKSSSKLSLEGSAVTVNGSSMVKVESGSGVKLDAPTISV